MLCSTYMFGRRPSEVGALGVIEISSLFLTSQGVGSWIICREVSSSGWEVRLALFIPDNTASSLLQKQHIRIFPQPHVLNEKCLEGSEGLLSVQHRSSLLGSIIIGPPALAARSMNNQLKNNWRVAVCARFGAVFTSPALLVTLVTAASYVFVIQISGYTENVDQRLKHWIWETARAMRVLFFFLSL